MRGLPYNSDADTTRSSGRRVLGTFALLASVAYLAYSVAPATLSQLWADSALAPRAKELPVQCPSQDTFIAPSIEFDPWEGEYPKLAVERLSGAVKINTETFDESAHNGNDPSYDKFFAFEAYLAKTFPRVFKTLKLDIIESHGILLTWKGSNPSLKPIIFMAHQDTVPVPEYTIPEWVHPPFEGFYDSEGWIWGRGAGDCKGLLIAELAAVDALLSSSTFTPTRTVLLSFGFDEEGGAVKSAQAIADHVESVYGKDSIFLIIDEGEGIKADHFGGTFVTPALGEKGYGNVRVTVGTPGGHSSVPPTHTSIGILASLITTLESSPFVPQLTSKNPFATYAQCLADHGDIDAGLKRQLKDEATWDKAAETLSQSNPSWRALLSTTQAIDIISGGVKVNALPEQASTLVNHRIAVESSIEELQERYISALKSQSEHYNLTLIGFGKEIPEGTSRYLKLEATGSSVSSPVSPTDGAAWRIFSGTAHYLLGKDVIVTPYGMTGNTDTRYFWSLTRNIYRFQPLKLTDRYNAHTVNERVHIDGHLRSIKWVHAVIQNADVIRAEGEDPAHTSIGILSALLTTLESNAESPQLTSKNPFSYYAQCLATHADESFDEDLRKALKDPKRWGEAAKIFAKASARDAAMLTTTQAIDVISGGVKVNTLPKQASAFINHRIAVESTVGDLEARYLSLLSPVAEKYNLTIVGFNDEIPADTPRYLKFFSTWGGNASLVSPAEGTAWDLFSGTACHVFSSDAIVTPYTMNGNNDTRWYWNLSRNIYRFGPLKTNERYNIHTVDERVHIDGHLNTIQWVFALIQNADNARDEDEDPSGHFSAGVEANRLIRYW